MQNKKNFDLNFLKEKKYIQRIPIFRKVKGCLKNLSHNSSWTIKESQATFWNCEAFLQPKLQYIRSCKLVSACGCSNVTGTRCSTVMVIIIFAFETFN